jgi:hypothetical protein
MPSQQRRVTRWEHQDVLDDMQEQLERSPDAMRTRRCSVEHPFGTIKSWMGATHFMTKGLETREDRNEPARDRWHDGSNERANFFIGPCSACLERVPC